jgi:hypothetical protein
VTLLTYQPNKEAEMQDPYTSNWEKNAYQVGMEQFQLLCHRVAEEKYPIPECLHSADEWEACLEAGCNMSPEQVSLTHQLIVRYEKLADSSIREHMVEPEGSYFGTSSCFVNAAVRYRCQDQIGLNVGGCGRLVVSLCRIST